MPSPPSTAPIRILTNNLLYDFSQVPISMDDVDPELIARPPSMVGARPHPHLFDCWDPSRASLFQTGWFVESLLTQALIIHVIRTNKGSIPPEPRQPAAHGDDSHHAVRALATLVPARARARPDASADALLAAAGTDALGVHGAHATREGWLHHRRWI